MLASSTKQFCVKRKNYFSFLNARELRSMCLTEWTMCLLGFVPNDTCKNSVALTTATNVSFL